MSRLASKPWLLASSASVDDAAPHGAFRRMAEAEAAKAAVPATRSTTTTSNVTVINGTAGADTLTGTALADIIHGLGGNDVISGLSGGDELYGDDGDDVITFGPTGMAFSLTTVDGGAGYDTFIMKANYFAYLNWAPANPSRAVSITGIEKLIVDTGQAAHLIGSAGDDTLVVEGDLHGWEGGGGNDLIVSAADNADITILQGYFEGGTGNDTMTIGGGTLSYLNATAGVTVDLAVNTAQNTGGAGVDTILDAYRLRGSSHGDTLRGNAVDNYIEGREGADTIEGRDGDDMLFGDDGDDHVQGGAGDDQLSGGAGNDIIDGGDGLHDLIYLGGDPIGMTAVTIDLQLTTAQTTYMGSDVYLNIEDLVSTGLGDVLWGNAAANTFWGNGVVTLHGRDGNDYLYGGGDSTGGDNLYGENGDDWLVGCGPSNRFDGGSGVDTVELTGGQSHTVDLNISAAQDPQFGGPGSLFIGIENLSSRGQNDVLKGNDGANVLESTGHFAVLEGRGGNDILVGSGACQLTGGTGNDVFRLSSGAVMDFVAGGTDDRLEVAYHTSYMVEQVGADTRITFSYNDIVILKNVTAASLTASDIVLTDAIAYDTTTLGDGGANSLMGDHRKNLIQGLGGADILFGAGGLDQLQGGDGDDTLIGGLDGDSLSGGAGIDTVDYAGAGTGVGVNLTYFRSSVYGESNGDTLWEIENATGSQFTDFLTGNGVANVLSGLAGNDEIWADAGADTLIGGLGADTLNGGTGNDTFRFTLGDGGDTILDFVAGGTDDKIEVYGYSSYTTQQIGADTKVIFSATDFILLKNVQAGSLTAADFAFFTLTGPNVINGTGSGETLNGTAGADRVEGMGGADTLNGAAGDDTLNGGDGDDVLVGGGGNDTMNGGNGTDTADYTAALAGVTATLAQGVGAGGDNGDLLIAIENVIGTAYDDRLTGDDAANVLTGLAGADTLAGGLGADTLNGGDGNDTLNGGVGGDSLTGGAGHDTFLFRGGDGADTIFGFVAGGSEDTIVVSNYTSYTKVQEGADLRIVFDSSNSILLKNVTAASFTAADINIPLGTGGGGSSYNLVFGTAGDDALTGTFAADEMQGTEGDDVLDGADGDDLIVGGLGDDVMTGGAGNDVFQFQQGQGQDVITDFTAGGTQDSIQAVGATFTSYSLVQVGDDLRVILGNFDTWVTLEGVDKSQFTAADINLTTFWGGVGRLFGQENWNDFLVGSDSITEGFGYSGNDTLVGGGLWDSLHGGNDNDHLYSHTGERDTALDIDFLFGGQGSDQLYAGVGDHLDGGSDVDSMTLYLRDTTVGLTLDIGLSAAGLVQSIGFGGTVVNVEGMKVEAGSGDDVLTGWDWGEALFGGDGDDRLSGGGATDLLMGEDGDDILLGGDGDDVIYGDVGADIMDGGAGHDEFNFNGGQWIDTIHGFTAGGTQDTLKFGGLGHATVVQEGANTWVLIDGGLNGMVLLTNVNAASMTAADFDITFSLGNSNTPTPGNNTITGTSGDDEVYALHGDDSVNGLGGNDIIDGGHGIDTLNGGDGGDLLAGGEGNDTLRGGAGADWMFGGTENDLLEGADGDDILEGEDGADTLQGGNGDDRLVGGAGADVHDGGANYDTANYQESTLAVSLHLTTGSHSGDAAGDTFIAVEAWRLSDFADFFTGSGANEEIYGDDGNDTLKGEGGADIIDGGQGNDIIDGGAGDDLMIGGGGLNDRADYRAAASAVTVSLAITTAQNTIGAGIDTLSGFEQLLGSAFNDTLTGSDGTDTIDGKNGDDTINGGAFGDILIGGLGADALNGGAGLDYASYINATAAVGLNLTTGIHTGEAAGDTFTLIERYRLGAFNDTFTGSAVTDYAYGAEGADTLNGAGGIDRLYGQADNDILNGDAGNDILLGGAGADIHNGGADRDTASYEESAGGITINLATGNHTGDAAGDTWNSVEVLWLSSWADGFIGSSGADEVRGAGGGDTLNGGGGADILRGEEGNDFLNGEDGDDVLHGGLAGDTLNGGAGIDTASYLLAENIGVTINLQFNEHGGEANLDSFISIERFQLSNGFTLVDTFTGSNGDDWVAGYKGVDNLNGMDGNDTLNGGEHADVLNGGAGADKLIAGTGNDTLTGGSGSDQFHFNVGLFGNDTVTDFENGVDFIRITGQAGIDNISDLTISQNGAHVLITLPDGSTITVQNTLTSAIDASDFLWI